MKNPEKKSKEWRLFEMLVAKLEAALRDQGYTFKSPDYLLDYDTNELREVDCSIRYKESGTEKVISVECRKRRSVQDVTWIEQLACKLDSLKLSGTIAVSSKGFSQAAKIKAQKRGILLRTYKEFVDKDVIEGVKAAPRVKYISRRWTLMSFEFEAQDDSPDIPDELMQQFQHSIENQSSAAPILVDTRTNETITLEQAVLKSLEKSKNLKIGTSTKTFRLGFEPNTVMLAGLPIAVHLRYFKIKIQLDIQETFSDNLKLGQYEAEESILMEVLSGKIEPPGRDGLHFQLFFTRDG